jgi:hypothetical protein
MKDNIARRGPGRRRPAPEPFRRGDGGDAGAVAGPAAGPIAGREPLRLPVGAAGTPGGDARFGTMSNGAAAAGPIAGRERMCLPGRGGADAGTRCAARHGER